jgi:penicillin-binding protein 1A
VRRFTCCLAVLCLLTSGCAALVEVESLPVNREPVPAPAQSRVFAADGSRLATLRFDKRDKVDRDELPQVLIDALVAAEDRSFYDHRGVDPRAIARAAVANAKAGELDQGGSTITQQLVKNRYFPDPVTTFERKMSEAQLAWELEKHKTKDEILTAYLNTVYFGAGAYGIQAAAQTYFRTDVSELTRRQAALLVGLLPAPEDSSPYDHPQRARQERARVLQAMAETGRMSQAAATAAKAKPLGVSPLPEPPTTRFPYFLEAVKARILANPRFGVDRAARERWLYGAGLRIHTTLEPALQRQARAAADEVLPDPAGPEVAVAVTRPDNGDVAAMVGGRDFDRRQFNLATQAQRQPGSAFKPFALVAALRSGMRLDERIASGSAVLSRGENAQPWQVRSNTSGLISLRDALVRSSNGAFARLALKLGPGRITDQAKAMGINGELANRPAVALGGLEEGVSPLEMAGAYATLATGGVSHGSRLITKITDADGNVVYRPPDRAEVAMDAQTAFLATKALRGVVAEGTGTRAQLTAPSGEPRPIAGKTGTSQHNRDAWFVGYTPQLSTAVWVGYPDQARPLRNVRGVPRVTGGSWPAEIWRRFMGAALSGKPAPEFPYPEHRETTATVDPTTGQLAGPYCPHTVEQTGLPAELPTTECQLHTAPPKPPAPETSTATVPRSPSPSASATPAAPATAPPPSPTAAPPSPTAPAPSPPAARTTGPSSTPPSPE